MIKAYIYGTPKGFDAYGSDKSFEGYLKGFYITSRQGKRLMVNRRANGETIYSYLHYGLMEYSDIGKDKAGRINSFFGMSLHRSDGIYTPDLKRVFAWFDYWFDKILKDGTILKKVSSGYIQYQVSKFANANTIEYLHSNLPNIFSEKSGTLMIDYDDSFIDGKSGQIAKLNDEEDDDVILSTFKHYQWVALSSIFEKKDPGEGTDVELDFNELDDRLDEYNKKLLSIAINLNAISIDELCKINDAVQENYSSITSYLKTISNGNDNTEEYNKFSSLAKDYAEVLEYITKLKRQIEEPETKLCDRCQEYKDISEFRSAESTICIACEKEDALSRKKCIQCGQTKTYAEFEHGSEICKACESKNVKTGYMFWAKIAVLFSIVIVVIVGVCRPKSSPNPTIPEQTGPVVTTTQPGSEQKVDDNTFNTFIKEYKYQNAYDYLASKSNRDEYLPFNNVINDQMWEIINNSSKLKTRHEMLNKILVGITPLGEEVITKGSKDTIIKTITDFGTLVEKLSLEDKFFGLRSYTKATQIISEGKKYDSKWSDIVESKYDEYNKYNKDNKDKTGTSVQSSTPVAAQQDYGSIYLVNLDKDYKPIGAQGIAIEDKTKSCGPYKRNTFIDICYDGDKVRIRSKNVLENNTKPTTQPQAQNYKLNATHRIRINKVENSVCEVIYVEDLTGNKLMEIEIKTKQ